MITKKEEINRLKYESEKASWEDVSRGQEFLGEQTLGLLSDRRWNGQPMFKDRRRFI